MEYQTVINEKFSINSLCLPCNIVIIGPTGSGKTTILKHILLYLFKNKTHDFLYLITNSKMSADNNNYINYFYKNHVIYLDNNNYKSILENFFSRVKLHGNALKNNNWNGKIIIVFDDIGEKIRHNLNNFTQECRHANISCILLLHHYTHIPPNARESIKYIFFTSPISISPKDFLPIKSAKDQNRISDIVMSLFKRKKNIYCIYDFCNSHFYYYKIDDYRHLDSDYTVLLNSVSSLKKKIFNNIY